MNYKGFCHLHTHNEFSLQDGFGKSIDMAKKVKDLKQKALALTNHGNVSGLIEHYYACKDAGIKPILGVEAYFLPSLKNREQEKQSFHLVLLVKNAQGYRNLMRLITKANDVGYYYKPRIDLKMLEEYSKGLICTTACQAGVIPRLLEKEKYELALKINKRFKRIFGDDYYLEVMAHNLAKQHDTNKNIIKFAKRTKMPIILTIDSHYINKEDFDVHKLLIGTRRKRRGFDFHGYHDAFITSENEIKGLWKKYHSDLGDCSQYIKNTVKVANKCNFEIDFGDLFPRLHLKKDSHYVLRKITFKRLKEKDKVAPEYARRLRKELEIIKANNFSDYFLICYDIMRFARRKKITSGFGRGSVAGSLVAYLLGITKVDPIIRGTIFERFLRSDKDINPDIDMDFDANRRDEIFKYIKNKFPNKAVQIVAYSTWRIKNTINEYSKIYNCDNDIKEFLKNRIIDMIGESPDKIELKHLLSDKNIYKIEKMTGGMITNFSKTYGQISHYSSHASGVAISNKPLINYLAIMRSLGKFVTSYDMHSLEKIGILKLDILGLKTMSMIGAAESKAKVKFDEKILENDEVIKAFKSSETEGIFQFETYGGKAILEKVQPDNFEELVACNAMNRPAPLKLGVVDKYILGKQGKVNKKSKIYKYCKDTYGQILYQEQIMRICKEMAKMDWNEIDKFMEGEFKDKKLRRVFIENMIRHSGYTKNLALKLLNRISLYSFNKSHAVAYSLISFYSMWLLKNYPLEFICTLLSKETNERKRRGYEVLAAKNEILIMLPHVNKGAYTSVDLFDDEKVIQLGLSTIKGIGNKSAEIIASRAPYSNEFLVRQRVPKRTLNSTMFQVLLDIGAMEFDDEIYFKRIRRYNAGLLARSLR